MGLCAYYAQWILHYFNKIKLLVINRVFPLKDQALSSFVNLKSELADITLQGPPYLWQHTFYGDSQEKRTKLKIYRIEL